eukprot:TRINITY_DN7377_c0_g1_i1.p1 TRINITY_DN7377_c0_g1~~TRINITY_DN7377_c0_g1_i1.p1  ORF type:complete len:330 (+),score=63.41 TRINITY_DN7377_c0_g1_i1:79-990(+)
MNMNQWQGMFDWSIRQQDPAQQPEDLPQRTEQEQQWLRSALEDATQDPVARMKENLVDLQNPQTPTQQKQKNLEEISELVEQIDFANDFYKIGGLPEMLKILQSKEQQNLLLKEQAMEIIAVCIQNNHQLKQLFFQDGILPVLVDQLNEVQNVQNQQKALLAISSLIRDFELAQQKFVDEGGISKLMSFIKQPVQIRLARKAMMLLTHLFRKDSDLLQYLQQKDVDGLIESLKVDDRDIHEAALQLLLVVCQDKDRLINEQKLKDGIIGLQNAINQGGEDKQESERESLELCEALLSEIKTQE